jgi:hypothetical protein
MSAADNAWLSVTYGNGLFVAVSNTGTGNRIMTSPDGITWTVRTSAADNTWDSVTYGKGLFVVVSTNGTGNRVMTSPDGITWTSRMSAADNAWLSVTYGNGLFVAVACGVNTTFCNTTAGSRVMTSPDGITWTSRASAANNMWSSVTYGNGLFVAVSYDGTGNRVMTSPDGITWTSRASAADNQWISVIYGNGLFVAVAPSGTGNRVMTSPDGITWTSRASAADNQWTSVTYGNGLFVAVAQSGTGNRVMISSSLIPSVTSGNTQVIINYTTPTEIDLHSMLVLRSTSPIVDSPVEGTTYTAGNVIGASTVACIDTTVSTSTADYCTSSGLTNGTPYYFKLFARDTYGNYSTGVDPVGSPATPNALATQIQVNSFRFRKDDGDETSATYYAAENTALNGNFFVGDAARLRFVVSNQGSATTSMMYQLEYATTTCTVWTVVPKTINVTNEHFRVDSSPYVADGQATSHIAGVTAPGGKTFTPGYFQTFNNITQTITLKTNEYTELEYLLRSTNKLSSETNYCFRLTNFGDSSGFIYSTAPAVSSHDKVFRPYAGGGGAGWMIFIEAADQVGTTTVLGGGNGGGAASTTEATTTPNGGQSTTTPIQGGGGGDIGYYTPKNSFAFGFPATSQGFVLGDEVSPMCTDLKKRMIFGSEDSTTQGEVSELQYYLKKKGYFNGSITGKYLSATQLAVKEFQKDNNLIVTGIVGKVTRSEMRREGCIVK